MFYSSSPTITFGTLTEKLNWPKRHRVAHSLFRAEVT